MTKTATQTFKVRAKMLRDFYNSVEGTTSSIAVRVIKRQFDKYYTDFLQAYEELGSSEAEDLEDLEQEFSAVNEMLVFVETKTEESGLGTTPVAQNGITASGSQEGSSVAAIYSYLLTFLILQKLPSRLRNQFEEQNGADPGELPAFSALMGFLDEVCRRQLVALSSAEQERPDSSRQRKSPTNTQRKGTTWASGRRSPPMNKVHDQVVTTAVEVRCIYCHHIGHEIVVTLGIRNSRGDYETAHALLDTGASVTAIKEALVDRLRLHRQKSSMEIVGIGNTTVRTSTSKVKIVMKPLDKQVPIICTVAVVMSELTADLPGEKISSRGILKQAPPTVKLADKYFMLPRGVELILGSDVLNYILDGTKIDIGTDGAAAYGTCFGHAVMGPVDGYVNEMPRPVFTTTVTEAVKRFWMSEEPPTTPVRDSRHEECERLYRDTTVRHTDGKFVTCLPLLSDRPELGDSLDTTTRRFYALERKMERYPLFAQKYREFMEDYERLGHMSVSDFKFDAEHYVIPHHGIFKKDSDKIRVVFDGSCQTTSGVSLNQCLHSGEALQNDITKILMNFRRHQVVFTTDVKQMFRMTWIRPEDRRYQLVLWRSNPSQELKVYELNTYGLRSSPFVALRTLLELAKQCEESYPASKAAEVVRHDVFVDDILTGAESIKEAEVLKAELIELLRNAGYELRKWSTNEPHLLRDLPEDHCEQPKEFDANDPRSFIKVLGIQWEPVTDTVSYRINIPDERTVTKRSILAVRSVSILHAGNNKI